jgi:chemotaxis protein MotB
MTDGTPIIIKKKKVHGGHAHHGGSWKVAYADFVTAMMAFFMVMWIMGLSDDTRTQIQGYFNDPVGFMRSMPRSRTVVAPTSAIAPRPGESVGGGRTVAEQVEAQDLKEKIETALATAELAELKMHVQTEIVPEGLRIELVEAAGAVFFETGSARIRPQAKELIADIAPLLARSGRKMIIEGHTDAAPFPSSSYDNWNLSADRANSLRRSLIECGVGGDRIDEIRGFADTRLKLPKEPLHFSNRRVTLLLPFDFERPRSVELPSEQLKKDIQGVFLTPTGIEPTPPQIRPNG